MTKIVATEFTIRDDDNDRVAHAILSRNPAMDNIIIAVEFQFPGYEYKYSPPVGLEDQCVEWTKAILLLEDQEPRPVENEFYTYKPVKEMVGIKFSLMNSDSNTIAVQVMEMEIR